MPNRAQDWLRQARRDLEQAGQSHESEMYEWACFAAHQAAEKAVKALHLHSGQEAWGHVVAKLLDTLPAAIEVPPDMREKAQFLDAFYIPTRCPNGHPEGAPFEHYGALQSEQGTGYASEILELVGLQMA